MKIEEAKKYIRMIIRKKEIPDSAKALGYVYAEESIETILSELNKKDKVIDMMTEDIFDYEKDIKYYVPEYEEFFKNKEEIKEYYFKEIEKIN